MAKRSKTSEADIPDTAGLSRSIGLRVRELRSKAGLTQSQLAERAESQQSYIFEIETGGANVTVRTLARLAEVLGADVADLLPESRSRPLSQAGIGLLHGLLERISRQLDERHVQEERRLALDAALVSEIRALLDLRLSFERSIGLPQDGSGKPADATVPVASGGAKKRPRG